MPDLVHGTVHSDEKANLKHHYSSKYAKLDELHLEKVFGDVAFSKRPSDNVMQASFVMS